MDLFRRAKLPFLFLVVIFDLRFRGLSIPFARVSKPLVWCDLRALFWKTMSGNRFCRVFFRQDLYRIRPP